MKGTNRSQLKQGKVIRAESEFSLPVKGIYRVDSIGSGFIHLSCGETLLGCAEENLIILERNLPEPSSWLAEEIQMLKAQVELCDCEECGALLAEKERQLAQQAN